MPKAFALLLCAVGTSWLVHTFGFGMLVAVGALAAAALLLSVGRVQEAGAPANGRLPPCHTTRSMDL